MASISAGTCEAPLQPLRMTCQLASAVSNAGDTEYADVVEGGGNFTLLQAATPLPEASLLRWHSAPPHTRFTTSP